MNIITKTEAGSKPFQASDLREFAARNPERAYRLAGYNGALKRESSRLVGLCPFHAESDGSFKIDATSAFKCYGCGAGGSIIDFAMRLHSIDFKTACQALGETFAITPQAASQAVKTTIRYDTPTTAVYIVKDAKGNALAEHLRYGNGAGKTFRWRLPGATIFGLKGFPENELPLYGTELYAGEPEATPVIITEGEKAAEALRACGWRALSTYGKDCIPLASALDPVKHLQPILWRDNDEAGETWQKQTITTFEAAGAKDILIVNWTEAPAKADAWDFLQKHDTAALGALIASATPAPSPAAGVCSAADYFAKIEDIAWTWSQWIPKGFITCIAGAPGTGKSTLALTLAGLAASGGVWPDDSPALPISGNILICDTEGAQASWKRLAQKSSSLMAKLFLYGTTGEETLTLVSDNGVDELAARVKRNRIELLIIDSLAGALGGKVDENDAKAGALIKGLADIARDFNIPVIVVHHNRKKTRGSSSLSTADDLRGTSAILANIRSLIMLDDINEKRVMHVEKANFCKKPPPVQFHITEEGIEFDRELDFEPKRDSALAQACLFLMEILQDSGKPWSDIKPIAQARGISKNTIYKARDILGISVTASHDFDASGKRVKLWELPADDGKKVES